MANETIPLEVDLPGRVRNMRLAPSNALFALFEAVVNSIHAVLDGPDAKSGKIVIRILRDKSQGQRDLEGRSEPGPVTGFQIEDNGVGFDDAHFTSFRRSDNTTKAKYGGKGVGRLLWLKVFREITVSSVFDNGKKRYKRTFTFSSSGIENHALKASTEPCGSVVILSSPSISFRPSLQHEPETFAVSIIEHCLEYFIAKVKPLVELHDDFAAYSQELGKLFRDDLKSEIKRDEFSVNGSKFTITHLLVRGRKNSRHALHLCANSRRVKDEALTGKIPGLSGGLRLPDSDEDLAYQGYVTGKLLDTLVDTERASFDFDGLFAYDPEQPAARVLRSDELLGHAIQKARAFLQPTLQPIIEANEERIRSRIEESLPQYRHLLKFKPEEVKSISPSVDGHELDTALYRIEQQLDSESREAMAKELAGVADPDETVDERKERLEKLLDQLNESGKSKLARHVAYRRAVIEWMEDQIVLQPGGKYSLEDAVHAAICPRSITSEDVPQSSVNLWLLDDRLYFHYYLASDMRFKDMRTEVSRDSPDRPDLAIFNRPLSFSDSTDAIGSVILVEFKRPARNDFKQGDPERDPDAQVIDYAETLQAGRGFDSKGGVIEIKPGTPFYAYIIADLTPSLKTLAKRAMFKLTPDGEGYFKFHDNYNMYIELISFKKMIRDAKKRNAAFFHQLGIPMPPK